MMNTKLNDQMKITLFDVALNHERMKRRPVNMKSADRIIKLYKRLFCTEIRKVTITKEICSELDRLLSNETTVSVAEYIRSIIDPACDQV